MQKSMRPQYEPASVRVLVAAGSLLARDGAASIDCAASNRQGPTAVDSFTYPSNLERKKAWSVQSADAQFIMGARRHRFVKQLVLGQVIKRGFTFN